MMKRVEPIVYRVTVTTKTGLHIGAGDTDIEIGGIDLPVVTDMNGYPYIPGSSLKGKLRSLLETSLGAYAENGGPHLLDPDVCKESCDLCRAFGVSGTPKLPKDADADARKRHAETMRAALIRIGPTRLLVRDLTLDETSRTRFDEMRRRGENPLERKTEVVMDRAKGTAAGAGPRSMERVPAGTAFEGDIVFRVFDTGDGGAADRAVAERLFGKDDLLRCLLEHDALGGHGSRGSGQVGISFDVAS